VEYWTTSNIHIWTGAIYIFSVFFISVQIQGYIARLFSIEINRKYLLLKIKHFIVLFLVLFLCFDGFLCCYGWSIYRTYRSKNDWLVSLRTPWHDISWVRIMVYGVYRHFQQYYSYIVTVSLMVEEAGVHGENNRPVVFCVQYFWIVLDHVFFLFTTIFCVSSIDGFW